MKSTIISLAVIAATTSACGGDTPELGVTPVTVRAPTPLTGVWTSESAQPLGAEADALGVDALGHIVVVSQGQALVDVFGTLEHRPLYAAPGEPVTMGAVQTLRPRASEGAWIGSDAGLFSIDRHFVTHSPLSERAGNVLDVAETASGPLAGIWMLDAQGLWRKGPAGLSEVQVDHAQARRIVIDPRGQFALLASDSTLTLVHAQDGGLAATEVRLPTGKIHGLSAAEGMLWVASDTGLYSVDGADWSHYPLGGEAVIAVANDPSTGAAWARSAATLYMVQQDTVRAYAAAAGETGLAVDRLGDVFGLAQGALFKRGTGAADGNAVTFEQVQPWLSTHCSQCHQNQTADFEDYEVFVERAEQALARVRSGDMPRCAGSVRCDAEAALSAQDYAVLEQWIRDGMPQ